MESKVLAAVIVTLSFTLTIAGRSSSAYFEELPDLIVELSVPSKAKAGLDIGRAIELVAKNIGKATAPGSLGSANPYYSYGIDFVLSTDEVVPKKFARYSLNFFEDVLLQGGRRSRTFDLAPGETKKYLNGAGIPADVRAGNYFICAQIDPGRKVEESNEENNVSCAKIEIERP